MALMPRQFVTRSTALAVLLAVAAFALSFWFGVKTAAGPDPFGYVSQAYLWLDGTLIVTPPAVHLGSLPVHRQFLIPLGYGPGLLQDTMVPSYPPGLPLMMAAGLLVFGAWGAFVVVPATAGILIIATYFLGRRLENTESGLAAAGLLALSPAVIYSGLWPMSDVPAAALWTLSLLALMSSRGAAPFTAGVLAGLAILVRPNLAPLAAVGAWLLWTHGGLARRRITNVSLYAGALLPFVIFLGWFNNHLYGSPLRSGYGSVDLLYSADFIAPNAANYATWLFQTQGLLFCLLAAYGWLRGFTQPPLRALAVFAALVTASYLPYLVFGDWWFLRFLLPAYPAIFIMTAAGAVALARRARPATRGALLAAVIVIVAAQSAWFTAREQPFGFRQGEHRFAVIGAYVRQALPPNAAFFTMHHSGSLRYYGGRLTVRYDWVHSGWLARARAALEDAGYVTYVLIDEPEEALLRQRFTQPGELVFLDQPPIVELQSEPRVRIYALSEELPPDWPKYLQPARGVPVAPVSRKPVVWDPLSGR